VSPTATVSEPSYVERLESLRRSKAQQTLEKQRIRGAMDFDDHAVILPAEELRETVQTLGGSGVYFTDVLLKTFKPIPNHPNGSFYGPRATGENFRRLLEVHPVCIDVFIGWRLRGELYVLPQGPLEPRYRLHGTAG